MIVWGFKNQFTGTIPSTLNKATLLRELLLGSNRLTGTIPNEFENIQFDTFNLEHNLLVGTIPNITATAIAKFDMNSFTGTIPKSIFNSSVWKLFFDNNELVGEVAQPFCDRRASEMIFFQVDDSAWFLDEPLVTCPCCSDEDCHMWKNRLF